MVLRGDGHRVEGHDQYHQPVEGSGLNHVMALPAKDAVPLPPVAAEGGHGAGGGNELLYSEPHLSAFLPDRLWPH